MNQSTPSSVKKHVIEGYIKEMTWGDNTFALMVIDLKQVANSKPRLEIRPLVALVQDLNYGRDYPYLRARYFISNTPKTFQEAEFNQISALVGDYEADYTANYSDLTGYLWTDETLQIGGHNLIEELRGHAGKYLCLELTFAKTLQEVSRDLAANERDLTQS